MPHPLPPHSPFIPLLHYPCPTIPPILREHPRHSQHHPRRNPILPADLHHMGAETSSQSQYPDDVHPDAWELCVGGQSGGEIGERRVECLGGIPCDRVFAGEFVGHGNLV